MGSISLPSPSFKMGASASDLKDQRMHCFPAADRRVFSLDQSGRGLLLEADTSRLVILPRLHKPKLEPISLYIPCADDSGEDLDGGGSGGGSLFIMDRIARLDVKAAPVFEVLIYHSACSSVLSKSWHCKLLPLPPPYILGKTSRHSCLEISSYAVLKGGSQICISVNGVGTYCLDTASYEWSEVGEWILPFQGKVEYVPELKLWFGFSASKDRHLAAADLSTMDSSQPQLLDSWKEIDDDVTQEWQQIQDPQLVNLGSGRLCIARFLHTGTPNCGSGNESSGQNVTVLTGVEVAISYHFGRKMSLEMVKHKSRCHKSSCSEDTIMAVASRPPFSSIPAAILHSARIRCWELRHPFSSRRLRVLGCHPILIVEGIHRCNLAASIARKGKPVGGPIDDGSLAPVPESDRGQPYPWSQIAALHRPHAPQTIPFPGDGKKSMKTIQLPAPSINFRSSVMPHNWSIDCFPLAGPKLLCTDHDGHNILFDTDTARPLIRSYAVVGGGGGASHVCFSVEGAGTYCLNTVTHTWTQVGEWTLPFQGKVEYVPELKLWLGICAKGLHLGVADLSTMGVDSPPRLLGTWKELDASQGWMEVRDPELVNLGSGRFCIARFFQAPSPMVPFYDSDDDAYAEYFTVLTGMDVVLCPHGSNGTANTTYSNGNGSNGKVKLQMISHNSIRHMSYGRDGTIKGKRENLPMLRNKAEARSAIQLHLTQGSISNKAEATSWHSTTSVRATAAYSWEIGGRGYLARGRLVDGDGNLGDLLSPWLAMKVAARV
ncbi:hypothetical protein U9M48_030856 [Paspalum notatum var. saurae]|uniref:Uncharacterized protein n=1 Tax=Paspalum notatum var. saurae TaxID=547442 RepID=A0AAQ3U653_PASNO